MISAFGGVGESLWSCSWNSLHFLRMGVSWGGLVMHEDLTVTTRVEQMLSSEVI